MKLLFLILALVLSANSQNLREKLEKSGYEVRDREEKEIRIIYERADGSVYEKIRGQDKFIEIIKSENPNPFIQERLVSGRVKFEYTDLDGNTVGTSDLNNWYVISENQNVSNVSNEDIPTKVVPNPTKGYSSVEFSVINAGEVRINLTDISGKESQNVHTKYYRSGDYEYHVDLTNYPDGVYLLTIKVNDHSKTLKIIKNQGE